MARRKNLNSRKKYLFKRMYNFTCQKCKRIFPSEELEIDHVIPLSSGGTNDYSNLQLLCIGCHLSKTRNEWKNGHYKQGISLTPEEKLEILTDFVESHKGKKFYEIEFMVHNDNILSGFNFHNATLKKIYKSVNGIERIDTDRNLLLEERDKLLYFLKERLGLSYRKMERWLEKRGFNKSYRQIADICSKFGKNVSKSDEKSEK